jgi:PBSX family phage terminase large subunit
MLTSRKQQQSYLESTHRYNIWVGSIRSGKTYTSIRKFIDRLQFGPEGDAMMVGVSRASLDRNVLTSMYGMLGFPVPSTKCMKTRLFNRDLYFVGAPDVGAVSAIKGSTLALAYVDEATDIPDAFWRMLDGRLSKPGAQLFATTNPDGPAHWLKKDYIDRAEELDLKYWAFNLDDNPVLDEDYKKIIRASYTGLWYKRYILGEWAMASGAIYDNYDHLNEYENPRSNANYYIVGIDYGTTNATAAVLCAVSPNAWPQIRVEREYYYDSAKKGRTKTDAELVEDIKDFIGPTNVSAIYVDPAAASFKVALRNEDLPVLDANNDVLHGIKVISKYIAGKNIVIHKGCTILREQMQSYAWDPKAAARGEDKPIKSSDHSVDALRYCVFSAFPTGEFTHPDENISIEQLRRKVYGDDGHGYLHSGAGGYF